MITKNTAIHYFDIYPKMVQANKATKIKITPKSSHVKFNEGEEYKVVILPLTQSVEEYCGKEDYYSVVLVPTNKSLEFSYEFGDEQEYYIRIFNKEKRVTQLSVYALDEDLFGRRPYKGDLHIHTNFSDGVESPEYTAGVYRKYGFDFMAITDHRAYQGSIEAIEAYKNAPIDIKLFPGEEVHQPKNHIHIVNFGGEFSVNDFCKNDLDHYHEEISKIEETLADLPSGVSKFEAASCLFISNKIREGNGLSIFAHPHWIANVYHVKDTMTKYLLENKVCDAFELLGGQSSRENIPQVALYNEFRSMGINDIPIVGSSDTHGVINNKSDGSFDQIKTICFAKSNEKADIIDSVKEHFSVAVESYVGENVRVHGKYRLVSYALFLLDNYFPIHDDLCYEEGRLMLEYICDDEKDTKGLQQVSGRTKELLEKCFGI